MNLARLNHILIPDTKEDRDRWRSTWAARVLLRPLASTWLALSEEGRMLLGFAVVAGLAGIDVARSETHVLFSLLISLIVVALAVRRMFRLSDVRLEACAPRRVAVGEPARFQLRLRNSGCRSHFGIRVERPFLPWDGKWERRAPRLAELSGRDRQMVSATARFAARGPHHLDSFSAAALVPLGLVLGPRARSGGVRLTVVPRIARIRRLALAVSPGHQPGGVALASHAGESMELVGVRPYRPGDPLRDLHAVTWARRGEPAVREYRQEDFTRVGVVLDVDPAGASERCFEAGVSLVAGIVARLSSGEELVDLLVTGATSRSFSLARSLGRLDQALDQLAGVEPGEFEPDVMMAALRPHLERLSTLVFVTLGWDERRAAWVRGLEQAGVGCRVLVVEDGFKPTSARLPAAAAVPLRVSVDDVMAAACGDGEDLSL